MAEIRQKIMLVVRPTGVYLTFAINRLVWLTGLKTATRISQPRDCLANGPMGDCRLHTGPDHNRMEVRHG